MENRQMGVGDWMAAMLIGAIPVIGIIIMIIWAVATPLPGREARKTWAIANIIWTLIVYILFFGAFALLRNILGI